METAAKARAVCADHDPEIWFPLPSSGMADYAAGLCGGCPLQVGCLGWAVEHQIKVGIWGGHDMEEWWKHARSARPVA